MSETLGLVACVGGGEGGGVGEGEGEGCSEQCMTVCVSSCYHCAAGGGESTRSTPTPDPTQVANKRDYVFEWVQRQRAAREDTVDRMWNAKAAARVLPPMDPQVLAGHKPQLVVRGWGQLVRGWG